jgi:hypothetical protein
MKMAGGIVSGHMSLRESSDAHSPWTALVSNIGVPKPAYKAPTLSAWAGPKSGKRSNAYSVAFAVAAVLWFTKLVPSNALVTDRRTSCMGE